MADRAFGICMGSTFESVALIPIRHPKTVVGFIFVGNERKDRISPRMVKFLERVGTYVGSTVRSLEAQDKVRQSEHGLPGPAGKAATASHDSHDSDEMELVTRLIDNANESIVISQDWRIIYVNNKCAEMAGLSKQDMIGIAFLDITHPDDRPAVKERYSRILNGEWFSYGTVARGLDKDGNTRWAELREIPFSWNGKPAIMALVNDITDRKRAEEALALSERKYRQLVETLNEGVWAIDKDANTVFVNPRMAEMMGYTVEEMTGKHLLSLVTNKRGARIAERKLESRRQGIRERYEAEAIRKDGTKIHLSVCASPILDDDGKYAGSIAGVQDITDRIQAEEALRDSERLYRFLADNTTDGIWVTDLNLKPTYLSPSVTALMGYSVEEALGGTLETRLTPASVKVAAEAFAHALTREKQEPGTTTSQTMELELKRKDGSTVWVETTVSFMRDSKGQAVGVLGAMRDTSERKRARETLRASEERYRLLVENASQGIAVIHDGILKFASPRLEDISGYQTDEALLKPFIEFIHPEDQQRVAEYHARRLRGEEVPRVYQFKFIDKAGSVKWVEVNAVSIEWEQGPAVLALLSDITDRKKAEDELKASEERFRTIIENARDAITVVDENFSVIYESPSLAVVTGYPPEEWVGKSLADMAIHPDDIPLLASKFELLKSQPGLVIEDVSIRYRHKDGSWHVVEASGRNLLHDPRVKGLVVNFRDITARRRMEEALRESELRYRLLAENASDVIFTSDLAMKLTYVSPSMMQLTGYAPEETKSLNIDRWVVPASKEFVLKSFSWALSKAKSGIDLPPALRTATLEMSKKDGGTVWVEIRIDFLRDAGGQPIGFLGMARDITDRRIAEMELEHRVQLEMLITEISTAFIGISTDYIDQGIRNALESISGFTEVDRSYIFMFSADRTRLDLAHEWCSKGAKPLTGRLNSVEVDSIPWLVAKVKQAECAHIPELADMPAAAAAERALFRRQGVRSIVVVPMVQAGNAIGFLGLGSIHSKKTWDEETIMLLRLVAEMFANALERKRMDLALRESEKRYRLLAENITDVIWTTDMQTNITYMSPSATRLVGYRVEELGKLTVMDLLTPDSFERGMKALVEQQTSASMQHNSPSDHWTLEVELRRQDGSTVWVEEKVTFLRDEKGTPVGLLGATRDISQRKVIEDALRLSEEKYRTLVEASPDGVLSIDGRGIITDCNTGLCRMLGYERKELRGKEARQLGTRKDLDAEAYYRDHLLKGEFMEVETEILRHDGQALPVWAKLVRLVEPNTADIQTVIYFRDITDRRKIDEMKDEFVGLVSHELRSPLTVIIGALHTAISEGPRLSQKETRQLLQDAAFEAEQLSHLVGNLLELSRAQANRLFLHVEPVNLAKAIHKVIESIERQSSKHKFVVDLPRKLPPVSADQLRLERILHNLLENGVKYSPEGSEIRVSAKRDAGHLVVSVSDHGPGISKEDQSKLFKPFQQLGNPMLDHTKGAGLGLLVCRRLVEAHGGRIWIESEPGHGATFHFTLLASTKDSPDAG
jgi:PAS domain S-box-containing protein